MKCGAMEVNWTHFLSLLDGLLMILHTMSMYMPHHKLAHVIPHHYHIIPCHCHMLLRKGSMSSTYHPSLQCHLTMSSSVHLSSSHCVVPSYFHMSLPYISSKNVPRLATHYFMCTSFTWGCHIRNWALASNCMATEHYDQCLLGHHQSTINILFLLRFHPFSYD